MHHRFLVLCLAAAAAAQAEPPKTVPEATNFTATSRAADVERFLNACVRLSHGDRLTVRVAGKTHEGRAQLLVKIAAPTTNASQPPRLRALIIGNIHAGEVEGKEAAQQLVREFASGEHSDLLAQCELWFLPIYNVDGNEEVAPKNRAGQNGPDLVGQRPNGQGLDLNRDFVKLDAPETRTLVQLFSEVDPHLFVDLHTTNGSYHGYHLTYAPGLSPNGDPGVARLSRALLDDADAAMQKDHGFATFDYGNFETKDWDGSGSPESTPGVRGWYSYDHRARYGINYFGLRNRLAVLSEAYSYDDFKTRIAATRAFVLTLLQGLVRRADEVRQVTAAADQRLREDAPVWFGYDTTYAPPESLPVLVGAVDRVDGSGEQDLRFVRQGAGTAETMPVFRGFRARSQRVLPDAWAIAGPSPEVITRLQQHGIQFTAVDAVRRVQAQRFAVTNKKKPKRPYQGHQELQLAGTWSAPTATELPLGTIVISAHQRLGRLAAQLLEPESEDSLSTWNFFEAQTTDTYPVLRIVGS